MSQIYEGYLDCGSNKTVIPDPEWFESFTEVNIEIGTATIDATLLGTQQGTIHLDFDGHIVTISDAIYAEKSITTLVSDDDILRHNRNWKYE
ncbi:UNVERIFIED_CONTAM: hypothetical protein HDU68_005120, partial [Siphonaria sp. JEL0065]